MVELFDFNGFADWDEGVAKFGPVRDHIAQQGDLMGAKARGLLAEHRDTGASYIEVVMGDVDASIILNDTRGQSAAMSIEFGRGPSNEEGDPFPNGTQGTWVLHDATSLPKKAARPNSRRKKQYRKSKKRRR